MTQPLVSIVCDTYNQKDFIGQTLDGFLLQKTDFPVEIIVHDDASTDGTAEIVRAYETRFPGRITGVYCAENRYSRDPKILEHYVFPLAKGKYTAICEGDDYWTDETKLARQIAYMEAHPDCTLCFHAAELVDKDGKHLGYQRPFETERDVPVEDVIRGMGGLCPTASIVTLSRLARNRAPFCELTSVDDAPLQIFFASRGTVHYFPDAMCAYRVEAPGSWTVAQRGQSREKRVALQRSLIAMHEAFDADTDYRYHEAVLDALKTDHFELMYYAGDVAGMKKAPYCDLYRTLPLKTRVRLHLERLCPGLVSRLRGR